MSIYAVNGKVPVAAWIPSRDTSGNGTTTLTDLVGSNNGTLTNMDAATDWVADTGAGGVRALDFDGVNDVVRTARTPTYPITMSGWVRAASSHVGYVFGCFASTLNDPHFGIQLQANGTISLLSEGTSGGQVTLTSSTTYSINQWVHVVGVFESATSRTLYVNGISQGNSTTSVSIATAIDRFSMGRFDRLSPVNHFLGRLDDIRLFNVALDSSDVSYLYNNSNGRGRTTLNRNNALIGVGF